MRRVLFDSEWNLELCNFYFGCVQSWRRRRRQPVGLFSCKDTFFYWYHYGEKKEHEFTSGHISLLKKSRWEIEGFEEKKKKMMIDCIIEWSWGRRWVGMEAWKKRADEKRENDSFYVPLETDTSFCLRHRNFHHDCFIVKNVVSEY